jgi:tRNA G10  N-methylase Trm11
VSGLRWYIGDTRKVLPTLDPVMPPWLARLLITVGCPPGGTVLDPYAGSGTTLDAAHSLGRNGVGIDLDERNAELAQDRLGMFPLDVTDHRTAA